jgi:hypothetical protein
MSNIIKPGAEVKGRSAATQQCDSSIHAHYALEIIWFIKHNRKRFSAAAPFAPGFPCSASNSAFVRFPIEMSRFIQGRISLIDENRFAPDATVPS